MAVLRQARITGQDSAATLGRVEAPQRELNGESVPVPGLADFYQKMYVTAERQVSATIMMLTPEVARRWLLKNDINRPLGPATVSRYAAYIRKGLWRVNGEPIILAADETMLDGQHRCEAVIRANVPVPVLAILGVDKDAFRTLNQGRVRSAADTLATLGEKAAMALSSALNWMHRYSTDSMKYSGPKLSNGEIADLLNEFPGMRDSVLWVRPKCQKGIHSPGPFTFLHYACLQKHPDRQDFFERVMTNANLTPGSPEHRLSQCLLNRKGPASGRSQSEAITTMALVVKAWNAHVAGEQPKYLRWSYADEDFPEIR